MRSKLMAIFGMMLLVAALWGCGSNGGGGGSDVAATDTPAETVGTASCVVCHTAIAAAPPTGEAFTGSVHDTASAGCEGCHGGGQFHKGTGPIPYPDPGPDQCLQCHTLASIGHVDDPATGTTSAGTTIEGYVVKTAEQTGCQTCHYSDHNVQLSINDEWADSAHGGHLGSGPATDATAPGWTHYNWDDNATRGSCQRCHTATGISNFLTNPAGYAANGSGNNFSHLSNWSATGGSPQQEVLYCWGCHSDVSEATATAPNLRNPGAIIETYTAATTGAPPTTVSYPDISNSNVCMGCHIGREVGDNIKNDIDTDGVRSFINSHYLTAGGTLFNESGYEYADQTYSNFGFHKQIGVGDPASNFNTGSSGPCVACHMSDNEGHTFVFVTKNADGVIEDNNSPLCTNCHAAMDADTLEATKENFHLALEELNVALQNRGIFFFNAHPYFYKGAGGTGGAFTDWNSVATTLGVGLGTDATGAGWKNVMGAAFNYNLLEHDPGAYAHNSDYGLKLIADSIDFLDNGAVDGSTVSLASTLIGQGMNIASGAGYSPIHNTPVATASAAPTTSQATCSACHPAAPHYGGYATAFLADGVTPDRDTVRPQWVNDQVISCAECHGASPALNQGILTQYAESGHADVTGAWTHEEDGGTCSRCHTTTGFINNLTAGTSFTYGADDPLQTLNCNACHSSIDGEGVAPRRAALAYDFVNYANAVWSQNTVVARLHYPNAGESNLCIRCHSARRAGANITNTATTTAHYLPAAAIVYGGTAGLVEIFSTANGGFAAGTFLTGGGYEFAGQVYAGLNAHSGVGGGDGPCVGCHMSGTAGHTWNAVTKNEATGEVTAINSNVCAGCHADMTPADLNAGRAELSTALAALEAQLNARNIFFDAAEGRFTQDAALTTAVNNAYYTTQAALAPAVTVRDLQGAAFNLWLFKYHGADPAGYVHNRPYALKLVKDSADMLNDALIDGDF